MAIPQRERDAMIEFLKDTGDRFNNFGIEIEKQRAETDALRYQVTALEEQAAAVALRYETETAALRYQVTALEEQAATGASRSEQAAADALRSETEIVALRLQVTALAEQAVAVAKGEAASIPEGHLPSRPCPLCRNPANSLRYSTVVCS